jgi:hypothetical protein
VEKAWVRVLLKGGCQSVSVPARQVLYLPETRQKSRYKPNNQGDKQVNLVVLNSQGVGHGHPICGLLSPMKAQARLVPPQRPSNKVLQRQVNSPSKGLKSNVSCQVKSHLIQEPPKHVHQNYLFKLNKCSKTLCNLPSLGMGGLSW